jgi:hypothetical protein
MSDVSDLAIQTDVLSTSSSRAHFLRGAAVAAASLGLAPTVASAAGVGSPPAPGRMMPETVKSILNIAATAEALAVTALYTVHQQVGRGQFNTTGLAVPNNVLISVVRAILRQEQDHLAFLMGAGGKPAVTSFTFPSAILTSGIAALKFLEQADTLFVGAYMAANREFAHAGMGALAQYAYQIGGTEAEHRVLARAALGELPPNNKSFETNMFHRVKDAANELASMGLLKPGVAYPGAMAVDHLLATTVTKDVTAGVTQRHP